MKLLVLLLILLTPNLFGGAPNRYPTLEASIKSYVGDRHYGYALSDEKGFMHYNKSLGGWFSRNEGLPLKVVYPFKQNKFRELSSLGICSDDPTVVAVTDGQYVYLSSNSGITWKKLNNYGDLSSALFMTAVYPLSEGELFVGTGGTGVFYGKVDGNRVRWKALANHSSPFYLGSSYYEQLSAFWSRQEENGYVYASFAFGGGLYRLSLEQIKGNRFDWEKINTPFTEDILGFYANYSILSCFTKDRVYRYNLITEEWLPNFVHLKREEKRYSYEASRRHELAKDKKGIYIRWDKAANSDSFDELLSVIKKEGYNAFVVDLKNDNGNLTYASQNAIAKSMGAINPVIDLPKLINKAHQNGIYVIGRIVVFKDRRFFHYKNSQYAIWNEKREQPWGQFVTTTNEETGEKTTVQREFWVDPFAQEVWEYNSQIAQEIQNFGVDEVQFDYIRFPSDGPIKEMSFRHQRPGMRRMDALESFLSYVRSHISIPISTDLYGYQSYFLMGNHIGQNISLFGKYVDVISPMYYPSHFPNRFLAMQDYHERSKILYKNGCNRSAQLTQNQVVIRPYVQAFMMPYELSRDDIDYRLYLQKQLEGVEESAGSGFILWNNSNKYYMLD